MITPLHSIMGWAVTRSRGGLVGGTLPDAVILPYKTRDALQGRIDMPVPMLKIHRLLHGLPIVGLVYLLFGKEVATGWLLHIITDQMTHIEPERTHLLYPFFSFRED